MHLFPKHKFHTPKSISSRAPNKASQETFRPPAPKNRPRRAPKGRNFAGSGRNWRRRTQPEPGVLGALGGVGRIVFGAKEPWALLASDSSLFSPLRRPHRLVSHGESMPKLRTLPRRSASIDASRAAQ